MYLGGHLSWLLLLDRLLARSDLVMRMAWICRETYIQAEPAETPNDRNDRAIRVTTAWYMKQVPGKEILLLTADADNRRKAQAAGLKAMSVQAGVGLPLPSCITSVAILSIVKDDFLDPVRCWMAGMCKHG